MREGEKRSKKERIRKRRKEKKEKRQTKELLLLISSLTKYETSSLQIVVFSRLVVCDLTLDLVSYL